MSFEQSSDDLLGEVIQDRLVLQDYCPIAESLEWQLGQTVYWKTRGRNAFLCDDVPFAINSDGRLSNHAAQLLFESLRTSEKEGTLAEGRIYALEIGVGLGLFARLFLDAFRDLCHANRVSYYDRLCYLAADRSETMLEDIGRHGLLANHSGHYETIVVDATRLDLKEFLRDGTLCAAFLNYLLDTLPFTVLSVDQDEVRQLCARTCIGRSCNLSEHTALDFETITRLARSDDPGQQSELLHLHDVFSVDYVYLPTDPNCIPYAGFALRCINPGQQHVLHNYGAIRCLESLLDAIDGEGFVLISDYALDLEKNPGDRLVESFQHQRFGGSTAIGVNDSLLESWVEKAQGCRWAKPPEDSEHICTRLIGKQSMRDETIDCFVQQFDKSKFQWLQEPVERARNLFKEGRRESALAEFREALRRQPYNWAIMGEVAEFLTQALQSHSAGLALSSRAIELNPISPELWNTQGDALFYLGRMEEAHNAFLRALECDAEDARTHLNLVYSYVRKNDLAGALREVANGLYFDRTGEFRDRLIERQNEILQRLNHQQHRRREFALNRLNWTATQFLSDGHEKRNSPDEHP